MSKLFKKYLGIAIAWLVVMVVSVLLIPNANTILESKGDLRLPYDSNSELSQKIRDNWQNTDENTRNVFVVFSSDSGKLKRANVNDINATLDNLEMHKSMYDIKKIVGPTDSINNAVKKFISMSGSTQIAQLKVGKRDSVSAMTNILQDAVKTAGVKTYITGPDVLNNDNKIAITSANKKIALIAAILIVIILALMFKSLAIPLIAVISSGLAYVISNTILLNLADRVNFPIYSYDSIMMLIAALGFGTISAIVLFRQVQQAGFSEEAVIEARNQVIKPLLITGSLIMVTFLALIFTGSSNYESLSAVGIVILVVLLMDLTLLPFIIILLKEKLIWPAKELTTVKSNPVSAFLASKSVSYATWIVGALVLVSLPFLFMKIGNLNYSTYDNLSDNYQSKKGAAVARKNNGEGVVEPVIVYLRAKEELDNEKALKYIDRVTRVLQAEDYTVGASSATQPYGMPLKELYVNEQLRLLTDSMGKSQKQLKKVQKSLNSQDTSTSSIDNITSSSQSIANMVSDIKAKYQGASSQTIINELQQLLGRKKKLTRTQIAAIETVINSDLSQTTSEIQSSADSINSDAGDISQQLNKIEQKATAAGEQVGDVNKTLKDNDKYLTDLAKSAAASAFYIPQNILTSDTFKQVLTEYLSKDKKTAKVEVALKVAPQSETAMNQVKAINRIVKDNVKDTLIKDVVVTTSSNTTEAIEGQKINNKAMLVASLITITILAITMMVVLKSILQSLYITIMALMITIISLMATKLISGGIFHQDLLMANVPMLSGLILMVTGVSYGLYLMMMARNNHGLTSQLLVDRLSLFGTLGLATVGVLVAIMIATLFTGVLTIQQLGITVLIGLIIMVIGLPLLLPGLMKLTYEANPLEFNWLKKNAK